MAIPLGHQIIPIKHVSLEDLSILVGQLLSSLFSLLLYLASTSLEDTVTRFYLVGVVSRSLCIECSNHTQSVRLKGIPIPIRV